jgi:hypothetical protein
MPLSKPQQTITTDDTRFRVVVAGRRFGKTFLSLREIARAARWPDQTVWYIAPTRQQAKGIAWEPLKQKLTALNWVSKINESELTIRLINGSEISIKSSEQLDSLRGRSLSFCVVDEFCDCHPSLWSEILRPSLSDQQGGALFIGTPKAGAEWAKELYDRGSVSKNWRSFSYTTIEGGNVSADEIEQARLDLAPKVFRQEYEASWENFAGAIFTEFGDHNIREVKKPGANEPIHIGQDFNVTPGSCVIGRLVKDSIEIFDEIYIENSNTSEMIDEIRRRYPTNPITVYPDPAGQQRKTSANGNTDIKLLEMAGFTVKYRRSHPLVRDRINAGNSLFFKRADGTTRFTIDPSCKTTIRCLKNWAYKEGTMVPDKDSGFDHGCDALTYWIEYVFPIKKVVESTGPQRFTHR